MMTQEEYVHVLELRAQGLTFEEIGDELGMHPATIAKWCRQGGPPPARVTPPEARAVTPVWADRLNSLLVGNPKLLASSLFEIVRAEGFEGSYPSVSRWVRDQRGPRFRGKDVVSVPIETAPGEEGQFDFADCSTWAERVGLEVGELWCFSMVLSWSRFKFWWFTTSCDREHTFEGVVRFFEAVGGVPKLCRTDRMGALGMSKGRQFALHPPALEFARHHDTVIKACQARDAKRKGKVERPFRDLRELFLEELIVTGVPDTVAGLNGRVGPWLRRRFHTRPHRTTGVAPAVRLATEVGFLSPRPLVRFDTDYVEPRRVHQALPLIAWAGVRYSVPPGCVGQTVEARVRVDGDDLTVRWAGRQVARHRLVPAGSPDVWDPEHLAAAEAAALAGTRRRHLRVVTAAEPVITAAAAALELGAGDYTVAVPDLSVYAGDGDAS